MHHTLASPSDLSKLGFISLDQIVPDLLPISKATFYRCVQRGEYPAPVRVSAKRSTWCKAVIKELLKELAGAPCSR